MAVTNLRAEGLALVAMAPEQDKPAGQALIGPAPGQLELVRAFVNTLDIEAGTDELSSPAELAAWLRERDLAEPADSSATEADLRQAIVMREALRDVLLAHVPGQHRAASGPADPILADSILADSITGRFDTWPIQHWPIQHWPTAIGGQRAADAADDRRRRHRAGGAGWPWSGGRARRADADRCRGGDVRNLGPAQGVQRRRLPVGVLRPVTDQERLLVQHGGLRFPREVTGVPPPGRRAPVKPSGSLAGLGCGCCWSGRRGAGSVSTARDRAAGRGAS